MPALLRRHWFLLSLTLVMLLGIGGANSLGGLADALPRGWIIGGVMLAMTLPLAIDTIWTSLRRPGPALLAVAINTLVVPLLAWFVSRALIDDLAIGLIIASSVPCTLASAAVWTRMAGGNDAVSLLVTMITNLGCFLVTPALLHFFCHHEEIGLDFAGMMTKLLLLVVLPIVAAQLLRAIPSVGLWTTANRAGLSLVAQLGLLSIVFVGAVSCGRRLDALEGQLASVAGQIALMMAFAAVVHLTAWWCGYFCAGKLQMRRPDQLAVAFAGSQKTLMVGLAIALQFEQLEQAGGLIVLPMLAYHFEQLLIDTLLVNRLRKHDR